MSMIRTNSTRPENSQGHGNGNGSANGKTYALSAGSGHGSSGALVERGRREHPATRYTVARAPRKVRVLEIVGNAIVGGMEQHVRALVEHLPREEFDITCLCPYESAFTEALRNAGCHVIISPVKDDPPWSTIQAGVAVVRQFKTNVIHAHLPNAHVLGGLVGGLSHTPVVATIHGMALVPNDFGVSQTANTNLILVCQAAYSMALGLGIPESRLTLIPNGVDIERFAPRPATGQLRARFGLDATTPLIGYVGRLAFEKGPDKFIRAAERVLNLRPGAHFCLVGVGPLEEQLRAQVRQAALERFIHFAGLCENTAEVYPELDLVALTSRAEGTPLAILEAMACGRPVVGMNVGGVPELIQTAMTGFLVEAGDGPAHAGTYPGDADGVANALVHLLDHPDLRKRMGEMARARVEREFDLRCNVRRTGELFERLTHARRRKADAVSVALPTPLHHVSDSVTFNT